MPHLPHGSIGAHRSEVDVRLVRRARRRGAVVIRDLREIRTKLYHAARGKQPATLDADEARAVLKAMDRPNGIYECSFCGALVRSPAGLQDEGLEPLDPGALADHADGCSYVARARGTP
jgi:hypothetical protein